MKKIFLYEDDLVRIEDTEDERVYIFNFDKDRDLICKMRDSNDNGDMPDDFEAYTEDSSEIAFIFSPYEDPEYPIIVRYEE